MSERLLFEVLVEIKTIVEAVDEAEAERIGLANLRSMDAELETAHATVLPLAPGRYATRYASWLPWGGDGVRTVAQIQAARPASPKPKKGGGA